MAIIKLLGFLILFAFCTLMIIHGAKETTSDLRYSYENGRVECASGVLCTIALFFCVIMYSSYCGAKRGIKEYLSGEHEVVYIYGNDSIPTDTIIKINFKEYTEKSYKK